MAEQSGETPAKPTANDRSGTRSTASGGTRAKGASPPRTSRSSHSRESQQADGESGAAAHDAPPDDSSRQSSDYYDVETSGRDAMRVVRENPMASLFIFGAIVVGGGLLLHTLNQHSRANGGAPGLSAGVFGPKTGETLVRLREAAIGFALAKVVESIDSNFPGFRDHFERA